MKYARMYRDKVDEKNKLFPLGDDEVDAFREDHPNATLVCKVDSESEGFSWLSFMFDCELLSRMRDAADALVDTNRHPEQIAEQSP